jgi:hypothetical protein
LPEDVACFAIAGSTAGRRAIVPTGGLAIGIVPLASALGRHANPALSLRFDDAR